MRERQQLLKAEFYAIQRLWRSAFKFLTWKIKHVNSCDLKCWTCVELSTIHVNDHFYDNFYDNLFEARSILNENKFVYFYDNLYDNLLIIDYRLTFWQKEQVYFARSFHIYFTRRKRVVWRNLASWNILTKYAELSKSTFWWSDDYDYHAHEWKANVNFENAFEIVVMILTNRDDVSRELSRLYFFDNILILLSKFTMKNVYFNLNR